MPTDRSHLPAAAAPMPIVAAAPPSRLARLLPSLPLLLALAGFARALSEPRALLNDPDTYLHLAAGRWIVTHLALPATDPFSHTLPLAPWTVPEWLAEIVFAAAFGAAGWSGVVLLTAAAFAASLAILARYLLRRIEVLPTAIVVVAGAALILPHLVARPHILALPLLAAWCGALLAARDEGRAPSRWLLPLMLLWANIHASFLFGLGLAGILALEAVLCPGGDVTRARELRRWGVFVAAAAGVALLTPNGAGAFMQPVHLMRMAALQSSFVEWLPPDFQAFPALELWLLGALALGMGTRLRLPWPRLLLLLGLVHMALSHVRHADLLAIVAPLAAAAALGSAVAGPGYSGRASGVRRAAERLALAAAPRGTIMALTVAVAIAAPLLAQPLARGDDATTPATAIAAAARLGITGPVFNSQAFGGYLLFAGVPSFIDGRIEMYGNDFLARYVAAERGDPAALAGLLDRYGVVWTLLTARGATAAALDRLPGWRQVHADEFAVVHRRTDAAP